MKLNKVIVGLLACAAAVVFAGCNNANSASSGSGSSGGSGATTAVSVAGKTYRVTAGKMTIGGKEHDFSEAKAESSKEVVIELKFASSGNTYTQTAEGMNEEFNGHFTASGTYTQSGTSITVTPNGGMEMKGTVSSDASTIEIPKTLVYEGESDDDEEDSKVYVALTYTKQ